MCVCVFVCNRGEGGQVIRFYNRTFHSIINRTVLIGSRDGEVCSRRCKSCEQRQNYFCLLSARLPFRLLYFKYVFKINNIYVPWWVSTLTWIIRPQWRFVFWIIQYTTANVGRLCFTTHPFPSTSRGLWRSNELVTLLVMNIPIKSIKYLQSPFDSI